MSAMDKMAFDWLTRQLGVDPKKIMDAFQWGLNSIRSFDMRLKRMEDQQAEIIRLLQLRENETCQILIAAPEQSREAAD